MAGAKNDVDLGQVFVLVLETFADSITLAERVIEVVNGRTALADVDLRHIEQQFRAARERLPVLAAHVRALLADAKMQ